MWESGRKYVFQNYFQECNQTFENIFQCIFKNASKHLKIISFLENIFRRTKHSLRVKLGALSALH